MNKELGPETCCSGRLIPLTPSVGHWLIVYTSCVLTGAYEPALGVRLLSSLG